MRTIVARALPVLAAALLALPAAAQETPEQVVQRYFDTFRTADYAANVALMHPDALVSMKETMSTFVTVPGAAEEPEFEEMFGVTTVEAFNQLAPATLFERILRWQLEKPEMREVMQNLQANVLGHVMEGDTVAHVVYRMRMSIGEFEMDQVSVAPVKRADGPWRVLLTGSFAGLLGNLPRAPEDP